MSCTTAIPSDRSGLSAPPHCHPQLADHHHRPHGAPAVAASGAVRIAAIQRTPADCYACQSAIGSRPFSSSFLPEVPVALLLPVLILIATASRLSAARREERFAAMRLVGATPRQISVVSAVEAVVAAAAGVAIGFALFFAFRPLLYRVPFTGAPFARGDLSLHWINVLLVVIGVPIAAVMSARLALRRVQASPFGVKRRRRRARRRACGSSHCSPASPCSRTSTRSASRARTAASCSSCSSPSCSSSWGWFLAGPGSPPGSRLMTNRANRPATLLAGRRLLDNPKAAFRFISGLVDSPLRHERRSSGRSAPSPPSTARGGGAGNATLADPFCSFTTTNCPPAAQVRAVPPGGSRPPRDARGPRRRRDPPEPVPSSDSRRILRCRRVLPTGENARDRRVRAGRDGGEWSATSSSMSSATTRTRRRRSGGPLICRRRTPPGCPSTPSSSRRTERPARSSGHRPPSSEPSPTRDADGDQVARRVDRATAHHGPRHDRRHHRGEPHHRCVQPRREHGHRVGRPQAPLSLLRLTGVPTRFLRRIVALESAVPLLLVAAASIVVGLISAALYLRSQVGIAFRSPASRTGRSSSVDSVRPSRSSRRRSHFSTG